MMFILIVMMAIADDMCSMNRYLLGRPDGLLLWPDIMERLIKLILSS